MSKLRVMHLFAGAGGGLLADLLLGHQCICAVEINPYCQQVLHARQKDGTLPWFPIFADVKEFDGKPWRGVTDVIAGGFPCQDISAAGKGAGLNGERSGLWTEMARIVREILPAYVFVENSPMLTLRGLDRVLGDLAEMGYNARWGVISAADVGAPHLRERLWIHATYADCLRLEKESNEGAICESSRNGRVRRRPGEMGSSQIWSEPRPIGARPMGVGDGIPEELDRIKAVGNAQLPAVARLAWEILS